jgi:transcriptional regulator GlxA family with amidase domain
MTTSRARYGEPSSLPTPSESVAVSPGPMDRPLARGREGARRAEEFLRNHLGEWWTVRDLCSAVNVSQRSLCRHFRRLYGCSPGAYHRALRVQAASRVLTSAEPGTTVSEVALLVGFEHFGRFALYYRQAFGESPRETLRKGGARRCQHLPGAESESLAPNPWPLG